MAHDGQAASGSAIVRSDRPAPWLDWRDCGIFHIPERGLTSRMTVGEHFAWIEGYGGDRALVIDGLRIGAFLEFRTDYLGADTVTSKAPVRTTP